MQRKRVAHLPCAFVVNFVVNLVDKVDDNVDDNVDDEDELPTPPARCLVQFCLVSIMMKPQFLLHI